MQPPGGWVNAAPVQVPWPLQRSLAIRQSPRKDRGPRPHRPIRATRRSVAAYRLGACTAPALHWWSLSAGGAGGASQGFPSRAGPPTVEHNEEDDVPFLQFRERTLRLKDGENLLAVDAEAAIRIPEFHPGDGLAISVGSVGSFAWAVGDGQAIALNGRPLNREPIPLFDGDLLSLGDSELVFIDDETTAAEA